MHTVARIGLIILSTLAHAACLIQPISQPDPPTADAPASDQEMVSQYTVLRGDHLRGIAAQYGTTPQALIAANQLEPRRLLSRGQLLDIPHTLPVDETATMQSLPAESATLQMVHTVHRGESPYTIAKYYKIAVDDLVAANQLQGSMLFQAQKLIIPTAVEEGVPQIVAGSPSRGTTSLSPDMPTQEKTQQTPVLDTETITVTETISVTETTSEAMPAASTGPITTAEEISVTAPVTTTGIITLTEAASNTVATGFAEKAPVELTALDAWAEPNGGIELFSPIEDGAYRSPIEIIGLANTQGGIVNLRLLNQDGQVLAWRVGIDTPQEDFDFFHTSLRFNVEEETEAELRISETSVADGAQLQQVEIPLVLLPGQRSIDVRLPSVGSIVCGEIPISGYSDTSQARVMLELRTPNGEIVGTADTIGGHHGDYREFFALLDPEANERQALLVSVSASDPDVENGQLDETVVPITLYPAETAGCP